MPASLVQRFQAVLERDPSHLGWTVVRLPFRPATVWGKASKRHVCGTINGHALRGTLFPVPASEFPMLLINKQLQQSAGVALGSLVQLEIEPDSTERTLDLPDELRHALRADRSLNRWFNTLSDSMQREMGKWIDEAKTAATRQRRAEQLAERLLLAMEGERELPPILRQLFQQHPLAARGWPLLTLNQRRNHLLGIFYYQSVDARQRRALKAVVDAENAARKTAP